MKIPVDAIVKTTSLTLSIATLLGYWLSLRKSHAVDSSSLLKRSAKSNDLPQGITLNFFDQKRDHDDQRSRTFRQRYWVSARHYRPGGPVIGFLPGQNNAEEDIDILDFGIVDAIAKQVDGLAVMIEHRYYGDSVPTSNFATTNLRWLTIDQSLRDIVHFSSTADLGYGNDTRSSDTPWLFYGGGYGGAQAAFLRATYPDEVFGAIASSAQVHSQVAFWEYWEVIRANGGACTALMVEAVAYLDSLQNAGNSVKLEEIKKQFGLQDLTDYRDFMWVLSHPLERWRDLKWYDPEAAKGWPKFCNKLSSGIDDSDSRSERLDRLLKNYAKYVYDYYVVPALATKNNNTIVQWYSPAKSAPLNLTAQQFDITQFWRARLYQKCTETGQHSASAPAGHPTLFSRSIDVAYISLYCTTQFSDAPDMIPKTPKTDNINKFGGFDISADRLLFIDGALDPWLYATPHSPYAMSRVNGGRSGKGTQYWLIPDGNHQSDAYGLDPKQKETSVRKPATVEAAQAMTLGTVKVWMAGRRAS